MDGLCDIERDILYYIYANEPCTIETVLRGMDNIYTNRDETIRDLHKLMKKRYISTDDDVITTTKFGAWFLDGKKYPKHMEILRLLTIGEYYPAIQGFKIGVHKPFARKDVNTVRAWKQRIFNGVNLVKKSKAYIDPHRIKSRMNKQIFDTEYHQGVIKDGDWDQIRSKFESHPVFVGLRQRFSDGQSWGSTNYVKWAELGIEAVDQRFGYTCTEDFIEDRCSYIDRLYQNINDNGYMANQQAQISDSNTDQQSDVSICIDREGRFLLYDGHHRVTIARLLGIDEIPVNVLVFHEDWLDSCDLSRNEENARLVEFERLLLLDDSAK